jgi:hypothetical protein
MQVGEQEDRGQGGGEALIVDYLQEEGDGDGDGLLAAIGRAVWPAARILELPVVAHGDACAVIVLRCLRALAGVAPASLGISSRESPE